MTVKDIRLPKSGPRQMISGQKLSNFKKIVRNYARNYGRNHLPWRKIKSPYKILVSEVMLQQTQVDRVIPYYKAFLKKFPTVKALAEAPLSDVLRVWQGLGYNRRAKMFHEAAKVVINEYKGRFPKEYDELVRLPGVGDYTAKAVRTFALNESEVMIETNIRTVFLHHFFSKKNEVSDRELLSCITAVGIPKKMEPREWYAALMDYGTYLKKTFPNPSRKSIHHTIQSPFKGSDREIRGAVLRAVLNGKNLNTLPFDQKRVNEQRTALKKEGLI